MTTAAPTQTALQIPAYAFAPMSDSDKKRIAEMREAFAAYYGNFPKPLKDDKDRPAKTNVITNRCGSIVNTADDFLFGEPLQIEIPKLAKDAHDYALAAFGDTDDMMTLLSEIHVNGGVCGHAFVQIVPNPDPAHAPRIVNLDPMTVTVVTDPDDCDTVLAYIREYKTTDLNNKTYTYRQVMWRVDPDGVSLITGSYDDDDSWRIGYFIREGDTDTGRFQQQGDVQIWPHPFPPIVDCPNINTPNEFWGTSDLPKQLRELNESINFVESNISEIIKYYGHPVLWSDADASQIKRSASEIIGLPEGTSLNVLNLTPDLPAAEAFLDTLRADMDEESRVPGVAQGRMKDIPHGNIPGITMQFMFMPLIKKVTKKQRTYGRLIREVIRRVLALGGKGAYDPTLKILLHWPALLPQDDLQEAQTALAWKQLGVSDTTLMERAGFDPEQEQENSKAEDSKKLASFMQGAAMPPNTTPQPPQVTAQPQQGNNAP